MPSLGDLQGFMKIVIPNETNDSIITKTLPVRPNMTTKEVCKYNRIQVQIYSSTVVTVIPDI